ncbi:ComF family protein [Metapseudomonas otitidis]|uniref:ComF family protein n=1 Tax=Metapseudomonas otitidis TaxID=319939 RepID=UPI001CA43558|nr:ComF family protein [Pseudomonas otitidis]QZX85156.1 ComF family protein [Pseudomonas otitidis]
MNVMQIRGRNWHQGFSLDKHIVKSTPIGYNESGYMQFDTERTAIGESVFQLKYRSDFSQVSILADAVMAGVGGALKNISFVIPMPASKVRQNQPVYAVSAMVAERLGVPYFENFLLKTRTTPVMKDIEGYEQRIAALQGCFSVDNHAVDTGRWNILIIDDLFDTGASLTAACAELLKSDRVGHITVVALTRRH